MSLKKILIDATVTYGEVRTDPSSYQQLPEFNGKRLPDWIRVLIMATFDQAKEEGRRVEHRRLKDRAAKVLAYPHGVEFEECGVCRKQSGSPVLCPICQQNRKVVDNLKRTISDANGKIFG